MRFQQAHSIGFCSKALETDKTEQVMECHDG